MSRIDSLRKELEDLEDEYRIAVNDPECSDSLLDEIKKDIDNIHEELDPLEEKEQEDERTAFTVGFGLSRFS
jgi:hypothetical protein